MNVYEAAHGHCIQCGRLAEEISKYWCAREKRMKPGSLYWTPLHPAIWQAIRLELLPLFGDVDYIFNNLFIEPHSKPFCSARCMLDWNEK